MIISQNFLYLSVIFSYLLQELLDNYSEENGGLSQSHKSGTDQGGFIELTSHKMPKENVKSGCCSWSCVWLDAQWSGQGWGGCCQILLCVLDNSCIAITAKIVPCRQSLFACLISAYSGRLCESSKILVGHVPVKPNSHALGTMSLVVTMSLPQIDAHTRKKQNKQFDKRKRDWLVQKFGPC